MPNPSEATYDVDIWFDRHDRRNDCGAIGLETSAAFTALKNAKKSSQAAKSDQ